MFDKEFGLLIRIPERFSGIAIGTCEYSVSEAHDVGHGYSTVSGTRVSNGGKNLTIQLDIHNNKTILSNDNYEYNDRLGSRSWLTSW